MTLSVVDSGGLSKLTPTSSTSSLDKIGLGAEASSQLSSSTDDLLPALDEKPRFTDLLFRRRKLRARDPNGIATRRSVYDDPKLAKHYWPSEKYENLHRFDPNARWTFAEEAVSISSWSPFHPAEINPQAIVRKIDWRVMLWAAISFSAVRD